MLRRSAYFRLSAGYQSSPRLPQFREVAEHQVDVRARLGGQRIAQVLERTTVEQQRLVPVGTKLLDQADDEHVVARVVHVPRHAPEVRAAAGEVRHALPPPPLPPRLRGR